MLGLCKNTLMILLRTASPVFCDLMINDVFETISGDLVKVLYASWTLVERDRNLELVSKRIQSVTDVCEKWCFETIDGM